MNVRVDPLQQARALARPQAAPVVVLGGWGTHGSILQALAAKLGADRALTLPGGEASSSRHGALGDWLDAQLPPRAVLVGWSLGGSLAIEFAARFPERVAALVTIACNPCFCERLDWPHGMSQASFAQFRAGLAEDAPAQLASFAALQALGDAQERRVLRTLRAELALAHDTASLHAGLDALAGLDLRETLGRLRVPTLHILGAEDRLVPVRLAGELSRLHPEASVWVADAAAHAPFLSRPEAVGARILDFLRVPESGAPRRAPGVVARSFGRAAAGYDAGARIQATSAALLLGQAPADLRPVAALDLGCGTGVRLPLLRQRFRDASWFAADLSEGMLQTLRQRHPEAVPAAADAACLPFRSGCFDLIHSNLALQWSEDLAAVFAELARTLRPGGVVLLGTLGPDTLWELRAAWRAVDGATHVHRFPAVSRLREAAESAGLSVERCLIRPEVERHASVVDIARSLKAVGAGNLDPRRPRGLTGRGQWRRLAEHYALLGDGHAGLPASWQLVQMVLVKPDA